MESLISGSLNSWFGGVHSYSGSSMFLSNASFQHAAGGLSPAVQGPAHRLDQAFDSRPVGVFDSGVGGLSILREIHRQLPGESVVYLADQAWAPYGERSLDEVRARSFAIVDHLLNHAVIGGEPLQRALSQPVGPGITNVGDRNPVIVEHTGDDGRSHAFAVCLALRGLKDDLVRPVDGVFQDN